MKTTVLEMRNKLISIGYHPDDVAGYTDEEVIAAFQLEFPTQEK